jgi:hypothetical protein
MAKAKDLQPDLAEPIVETPLLPGHDFNKTLHAIFSVPKSELDEHIKNNPDAPQKRGRPRKKSG